MCIHVILDITTRNKLSEMLKKLLTACALVIAIVPQVYASQNWETVGKTNTGETLSLDSNSVQSKPNTGGWLFFSYKVGSRQNIAKTASCSNGKLSSAKPGWIVDSNSRQVFADSVASQELLQRVCMYGKMASYSETNYNETDEADQALNSDSNNRTQIIPGLTNNGSKLSFYSTSLQDAYIRNFSYFIIPKGSNQSETNYPIQAKTHWCRNNRIEKDIRAVERLTPLERQVSSQPGWFLIDNGSYSHQYIKADSPASINLLKKVCSTYAEVSSPY